MASITLEVVDGPQIGRRYVFADHSNFVVGRAAWAHCCLPKSDRYISRAHFLIELNPPLCRVTDLGSRNGTIVNDKRVHASDLHDGDVIRAGTSAFRVTIEPPPNGPGDRLPRRSAAVRSGERSGGTDETQKIGVRCQGPVPRARHGGDSLEETGPLRPTIAGYEIVEELGQGGMGVVYLAQRLADGAEVAIKTIRPAVQGNGKEIARFIREAQVLSRLRHPGIVRFEDIGQAGDLLYFAMEYIRGPDALRELKKYKRPPVGPVVDFVCQALEALDYAHQQGYVHRDVKPSNFLLARDGSRTICKLADFGLARAYSTSQLSGLTLTGEMGGTVAYIAPEQIKDFRHAQPAADQYSTAASLYHMLTAQPVFDFGESPSVHRLTKIMLETPVPIRRRRGDIADGLACAIDRALEKQPEKRFPSAAAFREALLPYTHIR